MPPDAVSSCQTVLQIYLHFQTKTTSFPSLIPTKLKPALNCHFKAGFMSSRWPWSFRGQTDSSCRRLTSVFQTCLPSVHTALRVCALWMFSWCVPRLITGVHSCRPAWRINSCRRRHNRHRPHKSDTGNTRIQTRQLRTHAQEPRRGRCYGDAIRLHTDVPVKMKLGHFSFCEWVLATGGKGRFESFCDSCKLWFHCRYYSHSSPGSLVEKDGTIEPPPFTV